MFDKNKYIGDYIKENYRSYKLRVRIDETEIIDKLSNVDNINQYIKDLITKDIIENRSYRFIDTDVKIDFEVSKAIQNLINDAIEADMNDDYGTYMNLADAIDTQAKFECSRGKISEAQWQKLCMRFPL